MQLPMHVCQDVHNLIRDAYRYGGHDWSTVPDTRLSELAEQIAEIYSEQRFSGTNTGKSSVGKNVAPGLMDRYGSGE